MGDRVVVRFKPVVNKWATRDGEVREETTHFPEVYLHWAGSIVGDIIREAAPDMRLGDPTYQVARFIGHCHNATGGNGEGLSMGVAPDGYHGDQGDRGTVWIDLETGEVTHEGDYPPRDLPTRVEFGRF